MAEPGESAAARPDGALSPLLGTAAAFAAGAAVGGVGASATGALLALAAFLALLVYVRPGSRLARVGLGVVALGLGAATAEVERLEYEGSSLRRWVSVHASAEPQLMRLQGALAQDPDQVAQRWLLVLNVEHATVNGAVRPLAGRARVYVDGQAQRPALIEGDRLAVWARVGLPRAQRNPGSFDSAAYLLGRGIHVVGACKSAQLIEAAPGRPAPGLRPAMARLRNVARRRLLTELGDDPSASIVRAMVLGDRAGLTSESEEAFRIAGTYHVLALSGAQVALVAGLMLGALRWCRAPPALVALVAGTAVATYVGFVGGEIPVARAGVMAGAFLLGLALSLSGQAANLLGLAALALLAWRPSAIADAAFQLSFVATLAIIWLVPLFTPWLHRTPRWLALILASSMAAQLGVLPLMAFHFHRLAPAGLALNVIAVPLASVVLIAGFVVVLTSGWAPPLAWLASRVAWLAAEGMLRSSALAKAIPGADWRVVMPPVWLLLLYAVGIWALVWRPVRRGSAALILALAGLGLVFGTGGPTGDGRLHLTVLDVGAGDSLVLRSPSGRMLVVDTGGSRDGIGPDIGETVVAPYLWWRQAHALDVLALTHAHRDHVGGAPFLVRHFRVAQVWTRPAERNASLPEELISLPDLPRCRRKAVARGFRQLWDGVEIEALWPPAQLPAGTWSENDRSLMLRLRLGEVRFLLAGDAGIATESCVSPGAVDVLKVGHHGSRFSSSEQFLNEAHPRVAIFSTGGELAPRPEVLERYRRHVALILRTDGCGAIAVATDGQRLWAGPADGALSVVARSTR